MSLITMILWAARGAVLLAAGIAAVSLLGRASAATRHLVLLASFVAILAMPLVGAVAPAWHVVASSPVTDVESLPDPIAHASSAPLAMDVAEAPVAARTTIETSSGSAAPQKSALRVSAPTFLGMVWAFGALVVLARLALGIVRARRIAERAAEVDDARRGRAIRGAAEAIGVRAACVRVSDEVDVPSVTGVFSPVVLMPRAAVAWSDERWRVVLMHELAHVRRRDCLAHVVATIACALTWFNPLAWLAARRLRRERELAADDAVVAAGVRASSYATHLVAIAAGAAAMRDVPSGALGMAHPSELERRVRALVAAARADRPRRAATALAVLAASSTFAFLVACASPADPPARVSPAFAAPVTSAAAAPLGAHVPGALANAVARSVGAPPSRTELTIDASVQSIVDDELARLFTEWQPTAATITVIDPTTGAIVAIAGRSPDEDPTMPAHRVTMPASTFKAITMAAALDEETVTPTQRFFCENGRRAYGKETLRDASSFAWLDATQILAVSSNVGLSKIYDTLGSERLGRWLTRFHFGERSTVQLPNVATGAFPMPIPSDPLKGALVAIGEGLTASPLQVAAAYAALANDGVYNAPTLVRRVLGDDRRPTWEHEPTRERIVKSSTARAVMAMLEQAVNGERATGRAARVEGFRVAGKTGTGELPELTPGEARSYATFVGAVPADHPRFVILVGVEAPKGASAWGGTVAAPAFARIASRAMRE